MYRLSKWIQEVSTGKVTLLALVIFLIFTATVLPAQSKKSESYSSGVGTVDLRFWYSAEEVYEIAEAYGETGRQAYIKSAFTFDVIWPIVYLVFLATLISFVLGRVLLLDKKLLLLNLIPILAVFFDFLENDLASYIFFKFPIQQPIISNLLPVATFLKWIFIGISFVGIIGGLGAWIIQSVRKNN